MPLVTCPDCRQRVSDAAPACIHCGRPNPVVRAAPDLPPRRHPLGQEAPEPSPNAVRRGAAIVFALMLLGVTWVFAGGQGARGELWSALAALAAGAALLMMPAAEEPPRAPDGRRADLGQWMKRQEEMREVRWDRVTGWVFIAVGVVYLLIAAM